MGQEQHRARTPRSAGSWCCLGRTGLPLGATGHHYFDIPLEETLRRHATRPLAKAVSPDQLLGWYNHRDLLPFVEECIIDDTASLEQTVARVMCEMDWWCGQAVQHSLARGA